MFKIRFEWWDPPEKSNAKKSDNNIKTITNSCLKEKERKKNQDSDKDQKTIWNDILNKIEVK